jgi:hypothetical protein
LPDFRFDFRSITIVFTPVFSVLNLAPCDKTTPARRSDGFPAVTKIGEA